MTSTSSESPALPGGTPVSGSRTDLRRGEWTRLGATAVLGDAVTEAALSDLADRARQAARAQGYAAGWAEGRRKAIADAATEVAQRAARADAAAAEAHRAQASLVAALSDAVARCGEDLAGRYADLVDQTRDLAVEIAEAILQREISASADPGLDAARRALAEITPGTSATVRLNPADLAGLDAGALADHPVSFVADAGLARGEARVETESSIVDATVPAALQRVREVLGR